MQDIYADILRGIFLVRGENVLLLGEIVCFAMSRKPANLLHFLMTFRVQDLDKDDYIPEPYRKASAEEVHALSVKEAQERKSSDKIRQSKLQELGFEIEHNGEILI